ncbi:MAG: hypothetical protein ABSH09_09220 [Bryobacteraceae bacterium]|jgi:uncharacterized protein (UPF0332 family)
MSFADDLLEQAYHLLNKDGNAPKQASLRRAVSTAYYALFHLLIDEAVGKWSVEHQRNALARTFKHGGMAKVCDESVKSFYIARQPPHLGPLKDVAQIFSQLQEKRHTADYDSEKWSKGNAETWIDKADTAFKNWRLVRASPEAQDSLLFLFLPELMPKKKKEPESESS